MSTPSLAVKVLADRAAHLAVRAERAYLDSLFDRAEDLETLALDARKTVQKAVAGDLGAAYGSWAVRRMTGFALRNAYQRERAK